MAWQLISIEAARAEVLAAAHVLETETVPVLDALGRVLAEPVTAAGDVPPFASSAMDGYAIRSGTAERELNLVGESRAGLPAPRSLSEGEAIRISTGAAIPSGADAVIRQEDVEELPSGAIRTQAAVKRGQNIRQAGEVVRTGDTALRRGGRVGPAELAVAVNAGAGHVTVARRPRVRVLSTGDELRPAGATLAPGQIHDSNGPMLTALAQEAGALASADPSLPDTAEATREGLANALKDSDVVIVAGGVSVGPHDHVKPALAMLGVQERFWGVALQPGKPTWFGTRGAQLVFGLPGNPVSAAVTFALFVAPAIGALQGAPPAPTIRGELGAPARRNPQRLIALRVRLEQRDGGLVAIPNGPQGSHVVTSLVGAQALALIPAGEGIVEAGHPVTLALLPDRAVTPLTDFL